VSGAAGDRDGRPLVFEIAGPPGAGKSTLVRSLASSGPDIVAVGRRQRSIGNALAGGRAAASVARIALASPASRRPARWEIEKMCRLVALTAIARRGAARRRAAGRAVVFDQGPVYTLSRLVDLAERSSNVPAVRRWWRSALDECAATLDLLVVLDASDDVLLRRIRARAKTHRAKDAEPAAARALLARERSAYDVVASELAARGLDVVRLDAANAFGASRSSILAALESAIERRGGAVPLRRPGRRRTDSAPGLLVAVVGADGSGKSTLSRDLCRRRLGGAAPVHVYFGSGDGPASLLRLPMKVARDRIVGSKKEAARSPAIRRATGRRPGRMRAARAAWALALAREKRAKLRRAVRLRDAGALVVCDRYPQSQVLGRNDGPLLSAWRASRWSALRLLAAWESAPYDEAARTPPDLVVRLDVDGRTARDRRPGLSESYLGERAEIVRGLRFDGAAVVEIDARRPYEEVLAAAVAAVEDARASAAGAATPPATAAAAAETGGSACARS
jgi:thymidylate kinase